MENKEKTVIRDRNYKVNCECGGCYLMQNKNKHFKSNKHQHFIKPDEDNEHKVYCACGGMYTTSDMVHHNNTKRHIKYMKINFPNNEEINPNNPKQVETARMQDKHYRKMKHREILAIHKQKREQESLNKEEIITKPRHEEQIKACNFEEAKRNFKESILKKYNLENMHDIDINQSKFIIEKEDYTIELTININEDQCYEII